jgi:hypothetical protein
MPRLLRGTASRLAGILPAQVTGGSGIDHDSLANFAANEHFTQANITATGTVASGTWEGTDVGVAHGGTGRSTLTENNVILGNGTGLVQFVAPGADGQILTSTGSSWQSEAAAGGGKVLGFNSSVASDSQTISSSSFVAIDFVIVNLTVTESSSKMLLTFSTAMDVPASSPWNVISFGKSGTSGGTYSELTGETWGLGIFYHASGGVAESMTSTFTYVHTHGESASTDIYYKLMGKQDGVNFAVGQNDVDTVFTVMEISQA